MHNMQLWTGSTTNYLYPFNETSSHCNIQHVPETANFVRSTTELCKSTNTPRICYWHSYVQVKALEVCVTPTCLMCNRIDLGLIITMVRIR